MRPRPRPRSRPGRRHRRRRLHSTGPETRRERRTLVRRRLTFGWPPHLPPPQRRHSAHRPCRRRASPLIPLPKHRPQPPSLRRYRMHPTTTERLETWWPPTPHHRSQRNERRPDPPQPQRHPRPPHQRNPRTTPPLPPPSAEPPHTPPPPWTTGSTSTPLPISLNPATRCPPGSPESPVPACTTPPGTQPLPRRGRPSSPRLYAPDSPSSKSSAV